MFPKLGLLLCHLDLCHVQVPLCGSFMPTVIPICLLYYFLLNVFLMLPAFFSSLLKIIIEKESPTFLRLKADRYHLLLKEATVKKKSTKTPTARYWILVGYFCLSRFGGWCSAETSSIMYCRVLLFVVIHIYKVATDIELMSTEWLLLGEIQVPVSFWLHFHELNNT